MKRFLALAAMVIGLCVSSNTFAATCEQLKTTSAMVGLLVKAIQDGKITPAIGLRAGIFEVNKLELADATKVKVAQKTGPILEKGADATTDEVLPLFAEAARDLGAEAVAGKCPA